MENVKLQGSHGTLIQFNLDSVDVQMQQIVRRIDYSLCKTLFKIELDGTDIASKPTQT